MHKFEEIDLSQYDFLFLLVIKEVHDPISEISRANVSGGSRVLLLPKSTVRKILRSVRHMFRC